MKTKHLILLWMVILFLTSFVACEKEDYRDKYVGTYEFATIDYVQYYSQDIDYPNSLVLIQDTTTFIGTIEKYESNKLKIIFKPDATEPDFSGHFFPLKVNGLIYPVIDDLGTLSCIELASGNIGGFSEKEINIIYNSTGPLGMQAYETHIIHGIKIDKK